MRFTVCRTVCRVVLVLVAASFLAIPARAAEVAAGDHIELKATNPLGVPLHAEPRPSLSGRAADGTVATVLELANEGRWLRLGLPDGRTGWIVERYVARAVAADAPAGPGKTDQWRVWTSAEECEAVVGAGRRMARDEPDTLRLATWNIRWFPDGAAHGSAATRTDLAWLACALAWLDADVVALQEIRTSEAAWLAWEQVLDGLAGHTGALWAIDMQDCGGPERQHVGFLWNTATVRLSRPGDLWQLNGAAEDASSPCRNALRPGRYAYVQAVNGGADFHVVAVHLDSGRDPRDHRHRETALARLGEALAPVVPQDADAMVLGDFNTMGTEDGLDTAEEIAALDGLAAAGQPPFRRLGAEPQCTEYFKGEGGWLDHALVARTMAEAEERTATVTGYCALAACGRIDGAMPPAYERLSDHCPVVAEVVNQDRD